MYIESQIYFHPCISLSISLPSVAYPYFINRRTTKEHPMWAIFCKEITGPEAGQWVFCFVTDQAGYEFWMDPTSRATAGYRAYPVEIG